MRRRPRVPRFPSTINGASADDQHGLNAGSSAGPDPEPHRLPATGMADAPFIGQRVDDAKSATGGLVGTGRLHHRPAGAAVGHLDRISSAERSTLMLNALEACFTEFVANSETITAMASPTSSGTPST